MNAARCAPSLGLRLCLTLLGAAPLAAAAEGAPAATVTIDKYMFQLDEIHVHAGESVVWVNLDDAPHTVVDVDKHFHSSALDTHDEFRHTFAQAGTYHYFCSLHPQMLGTVVVSP